MKISELIEVLQKAKEIHGDIYIGNQDDIITKELKEYKSIPYGAVTHSYFALTESDKSTNYKTQKFYDNPKKAIIYSIGKKEYLKKNKPNQQLHRKNENLLDLYEKNKSFYYNNVIQIILLIR